MTGLAFSLGRDSSGIKKEPEKVIKINDTEILVEIRDTPVERAQGLSGREVLEEGKGMLFIFDEPTVPGFWMKDMNFSIDIVWIDENRQIVGVEKNLAPETYPQNFFPKDPVKYVLEIPAESVDKYKIATGTVIQF